MSPSPKKRKSGETGISISNGTAEDFPDETNSNIYFINILLKHKDERVRLNAASWCVKEGVFVDQAVSVLELIMNDCTDETFSFTAEILLKNLD